MPSVVEAGSKERWSFRHSILVLLLPEVPRRSAPRDDAWTWVFQKVEM